MGLFRHGKFTGSGSQPVAQGGMAQPLLAAQPAMMSNVPPGAPPGGYWTMDRYCGVVTTLLFLFCCICAPCCPCDEREVYRAPNGQKYSRNGAIVGDGC